MSILKPGARGPRIAGAARALVGVPFRPQGRGPEALDCPGVVLLAIEAAGIRIEIPPQSIRGQTLEGVTGRLRLAGFEEVSRTVAAPGDILISVPATRQVHLGIRTDVGAVEACARIRRVVERPGLDGARWLSVWRFLEGEQ